MATSSNIKVSAILPVYNAEETLHRAVNSLLIQIEIDEIFLIDDGSKDGSWAICEELEREHEIIKVLFHPEHENKGAPASRNLGLAHVKNNWIQFMDADDELLPGKIAHQLAQITDQVGLVLGKFTKVTKNESLEVDYLNDFWEGLIATRLGRTVSTLWNRDLVLAAGGWDESLPNVQEYHLMFEMFKINPNVSWSTQNLTRIISQPDSITNSSRNQKVKKNTYFKFREKVKKYLIEQGIYNLRRRHFFNVCTGENLKYHTPPFPVKYDKIYFKLYKTIKSIVK